MSLSGEIGRMDLKDATPAASSTNSNGVAASNISEQDQVTILVCFKQIQQLITKLESEAEQPLATTIQIDSARLIEYSDVLSHAITKFVLFVSQGEAPILVSSCEELSNHLSGVSCLLRSLLHPSSNAAGVTAGPTLRSQILIVHRAILTGVKAIMTQLQQHLLAKKTTKLDASLTGRAWEVIEKQMKSTPLTNATAVGRSINQQCSVLKDALSELNEVHIATGDEDDEDEDAAPKDEDDDALVIDCGGDDALTEEEFRIVPAVKHISTTAHTLVKSLYMYLLKVKIDESKQENIDWLELVLKQVQTIAFRLDDLIGALYSPQDRAAVLTAAEAMVVELRANAFNIVRHNVESGAEWPMAKSAAAATAASSDAASSSTPAAAPIASPSAFASCAPCQKMVDDALALQHPPDHSHANRIDWLKKCVTQIHEGHTQAEACR